MTVVRLGTPPFNGDFGPKRIDSVRRLTGGGLVMIGLYAVVAVLAYVFLRPQVYPCFGQVGSGSVSAECIAAVKASDPLHYSILVEPLTYVVAFAFASAVTLLWMYRRSVRHGLMTGGSVRR